MTCRRRFVVASSNLSKSSLHTAGLTLVEVVIALLFGLIMIMGTIGFSYFGSLDAHRSNVQVTAARLSAAILESWKANGGRDTYNPEQILGSDFVIYSTNQGPTGFDDVLGLYEIDLDNTTYYATLSYKPATAGIPKMLNIAVAWTQDRAQWNQSNSQKLVRQTAYMQD